MAHKAKKTKIENRDVTHSFSEQNIPFPLLPVDEADEYFDPFSSLNRFLFKKTKEALSKKIIEEAPFASVEQDLLEFILIDFKMLYPRYRLGGHALKKIYETVLYYYNHIKNTPFIFDEKGELSLFTLIRELISQIDLGQSFHSFHPYSFAYRIARQVTECAMILDYPVPSLDYLTKLTWSAMQNLLPRKNIKNHLPHSPFDPIETRLALESLTLIPFCSSQKELKEKLLSFILPYKELQRIDNVKETLLFLAAKMRKPHLSILKALPQAALEQIEIFLTEQIEIYLTVEPKLDFTSIIDRITSLYRLCAGANTTSSRRDLKEVQEYLNALKTNCFIPNSANLTHSIYAYVNSEIALMKDIPLETAFTLINQKLTKAYETGHHFPKLHEDHLEELKVLGYTLLEEKIGLLNSLSANLQKILLEEITLQYVSSPVDSLPSIVKECLHKLTPLKKAIQSLSKEEELEEKAEIISHQNEMVAYFLNPPKLSLSAFLKGHIESSCSLDDLQSLKELYLNHNAALAPFEKEILKQIRTVSTILSYHEMRHCSRSNYHFFLKRLGEKNASSEEMEALSNLKLPLIPYRPKVLYSYLKRRPK